MKTTTAALRRLHQYFPPTDREICPLRPSLVALALYAILAVLYTYPLALRLDTHIPGVAAVADTFSDATLQSWYPWWVRTAALSATESLLHSNWVFYPVGVDMTMQPAMFLHGLMTVPLAFLEITTANNVVILSSFALSGLAAFLLAFYILRSYPGALLAGFIYAFCPYKFQHLVGHYHLMATETLPLVALSLLRAYDRPSKRRVLVAAAWLALTILTDYYYFAFALLAFGGVTAYRAIRSRSLLPIRLGAAIGVLAFAGASPLLIPALTTASTTDYAVAGGHDEHKADLLSLVVPGERQAISAPFRPWLRSWLDTEAVDDAEHSIYIGLTALFLCGLCARQAWRSNRDTRLWMVGAAAFFLLALGPSLSVNGFETGLPLPYAALMELPFFEGARAPARAAIVGMIGIAVWAGFGLRALLARPGRVAGLPLPLWAAAAVAALAVEYALPITLSRIEIPQPVQAILGDPEPGILVTSPMVPGRTAFSQPLHRRKMMAVNFGRTDYSVQQYYWRHLALGFLVLPHWASDAPSREDASYASNLLGVRYIAVDHTRYEDESIAAALITDIRERYGVRRIATDGAVTVLRRDEPIWRPPSLQVGLDDPRSGLHLGYGWSNRALFDGAHLAWIVGSAGKVVLPAAQDRDYVLGMVLRVLCAEGMRIRVDVDRREVDTFELKPGDNLIDVSLPAHLLERDEANVVTLVPSVRSDFPHRTAHLPVRADLPFPIEVRSGGYWTKGYGKAEIAVGDTTVFMLPRGIFVAAIDPVTGRITATTAVKGLGRRVADLESCIRSLPDDAIVALAVRTAAYLPGGPIGQALKLLGAPPETTLPMFCGLALVGKKDGSRPLIDYGVAESVVGSGAPATADASVGLVGFLWQAR